ncbi:MAG: ribosome biogenesis GTP-binding protein YihA/YsxC [Longimicrobiales bacterium]|nr:ribosome biogenesis GTP-binding protein YihA/YsxC [Longimicrobiales bacterium]
MKIRTVEYAGTLAAPDGPIPGDLPQVAFSGRSNVGKSSLINLLLRRTRHRIAHVSGQPGKTRAVNFYRVNDAFFLADLPGFGYARVPRPLRQGWKALVEGYLSREDGPRGVVHLVDSRHDPTTLDLEMLDYLATSGLPALVVLTKVDKLKSSRRERILLAAVEKLGLDPEQVLPVSAHTGEGREALLDAVAALLGLEAGEEEA